MAGRIRVVRVSQGFFSCKLKINLDEVILGIGVWYLCEERVLCLLVTSCSWIPEYSVICSIP